MAMTFAWRPESRFPIGAQVAAERLNIIKQAAGGITPSAVVDDARGDNSPLHPCFEWDDPKAAEGFRLAQARKLIGSIVVVEVGENPVNKETRAFVHTSISEPRYEPIEVAMSRPDIRAEVLARARGEIANWKARYAAYSEFARLHATIDELLADETAAA